MRTEEALNTRLEEIDSQIFNLVRDRLDVCREIVEAGYVLGEASCDPKRDEDLLEQRVRNYSNLPSQVVRRVQGALIQSGKEAQYLRRRELIYSREKCSVSD